jgi:hypothetical protein
MSDHQVQAFLAARGSGCVAGEQACLKDYTMTTGARAADLYCRGYTGGLVQSAAQIIVGVAGSCGVNPQVLLVLLEKEQRLVTRTQPTSTQYTKAVGYGCPDTAPCNPAYAGLFNQLYSAAHRFQEYADPANNFRYKAGQWNSIYYDTDPACGAGNVFIVNRATAGLYNYTPYQPNAAAMANLYGTGDACSAYGNRNFWRMFSDWFGNPQAGGGYLMRTAENGTVYLVSGSSKYVVPDLGMLSALTPLGPVGFVSQQYLDRRPTVAVMSRVILAPDGTVYFFDAGIKLPFVSCGQVADYGGSCSSLVRLEQPLIDAFYSGPPITPIYRTTSGKAFLVSGGVKREVADEVALAQAGLPTASVTLLETGVAHLPYGAPVIRDGVVLRNRSTGAVSVVAGGGLTTVSESVQAVALSSVPVRELDDVSMRFLPAASVPGALVKEAGGPRVFLLTERGKKVVTDPAMLPAAVPEMSVAALELFADAGTLDAGTFLKGSTDGSVFVLRGGELRGISAWADLIALNGGDPAPRILQIDQRLADLVARGPLQLGPGATVVSPGSATVYFVNGPGELIPVGSFAVTNELGATRLARVSDADIAAYTVRPGLVGTAVECAGTRYLGLGGKLYPVGADVAAHYPLTYMPIDATTCAALPKASGGLTRFLRGGDGSIYYVENGVKRPIPSYGAYLALGGTSANTIQTSNFALSLIPTGSLWSAAQPAIPAPAAVAPTTRATPEESDGGSSSTAAGQTSTSPTPTPGATP